MNKNRPPIHETLRVLESQEIYRNDDWWKSVVRYQHEDSDSSEVAVYLWNNDQDGWTRKHKYVIKTEEAWETDKTVVDHLWMDETEDVSDDEFPLSDYYSLSAGESIFKSDGWWKAIVKLDQKGSYETEEVMIYLWQQIDEDWRRRQKYNIKDHESWQEETQIIESMLGTTDSSTTQGSSETSSEESRETEKSRDRGVTEIGEFEQLNRELENHLSENPE